jgi:hypothetical protein
MKKKILVIFLIGMFILTALPGIASLSVKEKVDDTSGNNDEKLDFYMKGTNEILNLNGKNWLKIAEVPLCETVQNDCFVPPFDNGWLSEFNVKGAYNTETGYVKAHLVQLYDADVEAWASLRSREFYISDFGLTEATDILFYIDEPSEVTWYTTDTGAVSRIFIGEDSWEWDMTDMEWRWESHIGCFRDYAGDQKTESLKGRYEVSILEPNKKYRVNCAVLAKCFGGDSVAYVEATFACVNLYKLVGVEITRPENHLYYNDICYQFNLPYPVIMGGLTVEAKAPDADKVEFTISSYGSHHIFQTKTDTSSPFSVKFTDGRVQTICYITATAYWDNQILSDSKKAIIIGFS